MPVHPMVTQLRFARSEFRRCLEGVSGEDAIRRLEPMNSISWIVGHLANQEHGYWVVAGQDRNIAPGLNRQVGFGRPATTPPLSEMWTIWQTVTANADLFLDSLTSESLVQHFQRIGKPMLESIGTMLYRNIYHYWFHTGEAHAVRQMLGHRDLPQFVGDISQAIYRPESE